MICRKIGSLGCPHLPSQGLDYAGPLYLKGTLDLSIHLLCHLSATLGPGCGYDHRNIHSMLRAVCGQEGNPLIDNCKTFKSADKVISKMLNHPKKFPVYVLRGTSILRKRHGVDIFLLKDW